MNHVRRPCRTVTGLLRTDLFEFTTSTIGPAAGNATTLEDFDRAAGETRNLSAIDAIASTPTNDAFTFLPGNGDAFSGIAGQLRWADQGAHRQIEGDTNGDMVADLTIFVTAPSPVTANWFVL